MFGQEIIPTAVRTPISKRLLGFMSYFTLVERTDYPEWCERRYAEAWPFRARIVR